MIYFIKSIRGKIKKKRFLSLALALTMMISLVSCSKKDETIPYTFGEVLEMFADDTNLDELMEVAQPISITEEESNKEMELSEAIKSLEVRLQINDVFIQNGIAANQQQTPDKNDKYSNLSPDDAKILLESLEKDNLSDIEKLRICAGLSQAATDNKKWLQDNGLPISEALLKAVIKAAVCEYSGLEIENYNSCFIGSAPNKNEEPITPIVLKDPESAYELTYNIPVNRQNPLSDALRTLYVVQKTGDHSFDFAIHWCKQALECSKLIATSGVELDDNFLVSTESPKDARAKILSKKTNETSTGPKED